MELLPLAVIGWALVVASGGAIALGGWLIAGMLRRGGELRDHVASRVLDDFVLFGIWMLGFAGGVGLLLLKPWSRWAVELFCWAVTVLLLMSSYSRLRVVEPPRSHAVMGHLLFLIPVIAFCAATILTLRSESALRALGS